MGYRNGSRLFDEFMPASASGLVWLWFSKQDRGIFGGDKIRDRFGATMRSSQLEMVFDVVRKRRRLCGTVRIRSGGGLDSDGSKLKLLVRGCPPLVSRKEFTSVFERVRGDTVWPDDTQQAYRKLVHLLRAEMGNE